MIALARLGIGKLEHSSASFETNIDGQRKSDDGWCSLGYWCVHEMKVHGSEHDNADAHGGEGAQRANE